MYDPVILQRFASRMYSRAAQAVVIWTLIGALAGLTAGMVLTTAIAPVSKLTGAARVDFTMGAAAWLCMAIGGAIGLIIGLEKAFWMKLEAQKVLCLLQTEINTRAVSPSGGSGIGPPPGQ